MMSATKLEESTELAQGVSVIIPTYGRPVLCEELLASLKQSQAYCLVPTEIWVVDDSPILDDALSIRASCQSAGAQYARFTGSVAEKRNWGAKKAQYIILLFVDSDCIATQSLIQSHWISYQENPKQSAAVGRTEFVGERNWLWQVVELSPYLNAFFAYDCYPLLWGASNNLSCRQADFMQIGGFDEFSPRPHGSEDVDFGYQLYYKDKLMLSCPEATIYHSTQTWKTLREVLLRLIRWSRGEAYIIERYWSELYYDCPSRYGCVLLLTILGIVLALLSNQIAWLFSPFSFLIVNFSFALLLRLFDKPKYIKRTVQLIAAEALVLFYETALSYHFIAKKLYLKPFFTCLLIRPKDALAEWNSRTFEMGRRFLEISTSGLIIYNWIYRV